MDRQGDIGRKSGLECLDLRGLEAFGVMDTVDDGHEHGSSGRGECRDQSADLLSQSRVTSNGTPGAEPSTQSGSVEEYRRVQGPGEWTGVGRRLIAPGD